MPIKSPSRAVVLSILSTFMLAAPALADSYVAGVNYANGQLYALCFDDENGTATRSKTLGDGGKRPVSMVFFSGKTDELGKDALQLLVADEAGQIKRFEWGEQLTIGVEPQKRCDVIEISASHTFYDKRDGKGPAAPNGLSVAPGDKLLALSPGKRNAGELWRFDLLAPGQAPTRLLNNLPYGSLQETLVLPASMGNASLHEDVLIVANTPDAIVKVDRSCYASGQCTNQWSEFIGGSSGVPLPSTPTGIALLPEPHQDRLLVMTESGEVALYNLQGGAPVLEDPALLSGLGNGKFKIKTLRDIDVNQSRGSNQITFKAHLFVAGRNNGSVLQITLIEENDGIAVESPDFLEVNQGIQHPRALAVTSEDFIRIPACSDNCPQQIVVNISTVIEHRFDLSSQTGEPISGYLGETFQVFADPRPGCHRDFVNQVPGPLYIWQDNLYMQDPDPVTPSDPVSTSVMIPSHLCGSPDNDPHIMLVRTVSNIEVTRSEVEHRIFDTDFDNDGEADLDCYTYDKLRQPAAGWAPIPELSEDGIVEGRQVIDLATGCGSVRMKTRELSYFVLGLRNKIQPDTPAINQFAQILLREFQGLRQTLVEAQYAPACVGDLQAATQMENDILAIEGDLNNLTLGNLKSDMLSLLQRLRDNANFLNVAAKGQGCTQNSLGDLRSRMTHIYFNGATKLLGQVWAPDCPYEVNLEYCLY